MLEKGIHFHAIDLHEDLTTMHLRRKVLISQRSFCMNNKMLTINSFIVLFYIVLARLPCLYKRIVSIIVRNIFILVLMCDYDLCWKLFTVFESIKYPSWESEIMPWQLMQNKTRNYCVYKIVMLGQTYSLNINGCLILVFMILDSSLIDMFSKF